MRLSIQRAIKKTVPFYGMAMCVVSLLCAGCSDSIDKVTIGGNPGKAGVVINAKSCITCASRYCYESCPVRAVEELTIESRVVYVIDAEKCIRCGVCIEKCPYGAIDWRP